MSGAAAGAGLGRRRGLEPGVLVSAPPAQPRVAQTFQGWKQGAAAAPCALGLRDWLDLLFSSSFPARFRAVTHSPGRREAGERSHLFLGKGDFTTPQSSQKAVAGFSAGHKCRHASGYTGQGVFVSQGTRLAFQGWKQVPGVVRKVLSRGLVL